MQAELRPHRKGEIKEMVARRQAVDGRWQHIKRGQREQLFSLLLYLPAERDEDAGHQREEHRLQNQRDEIMWGIKEMMQPQNCGDRGGGRAVTGRREDSGRAVDDREGAVGGAVSTAVHRAP